MNQDKDREHRIDMEIVVDAYSDNERAMGWYYYLEGKMTFPVKARCKTKRAISPIKAGEVVTIRGMAPEDECESEVLVLIDYADDSLAVPLAQLVSLSKDQETNEAIEDWHYWVAQGYQF